MDRIITVNGLIKFLKELDGQSTNYCHVYSQMSELLDTYNTRKKLYDIDLLWDLANAILKEYGEIAKVEVVKQLTHEQLVKIVGFDFVEVDY